MSETFDDRAPWDDEWDVTDLRRAADAGLVTPGDPMVPPDAQWDGHDDGEPLDEAAIDALVVPEPEVAAGGTVAVTEDWLLASPNRARELVDALRVGLLTRVRSLAAEGAAARTTAGRRPSSSDLLAEAQTMARAYGLLEDLASLFTDLRKEAAASLVEAMQDHLPGRKSAKVSTPDGGQISISLAAATTGMSVDEAAVLDILGSAVIAEQQRMGGMDDTEAVAFAAGARDGIAALRGLLSASPGWTKGKLDALVTQLQTAGEGPLAARLEGSYARVEKGEPRPTLTVEYPS